jgi:hypothetical protein
MQLYVTNHSDDTEKLFEGTPDHIQQLLFFHYPWLRSNAQEDRGNLLDTIEHLDSTAHFEVNFDPSSPELDHLYQEDMSDDDLIEDSMDESE